MNVNLNNMVRLKLTDTGKAVYQDFTDCVDPVPDVVDVELWEFASMFGNQLYNGQVNAPFTVDNELEILNVN